MFIARTVAQRTQPGQRQTVKNDDYFCHAYVKADLGIAAVVVADGEYPTTAAFSVINKVGVTRGRGGWEGAEAHSEGLPGSSGPTTTACGMLMHPSGQVTRVYPLQAASRILLPVLGKAVGSP